MNVELEFELSEELKKREDIEIEKADEKRRSLRAFVEADEQKRSAMVLKIIPDIKFNRVLDIGCGLGICMKTLASRSRRIIGIDVNIVGKKLNPDLDIRQFDLNSGKLPFDDDAFDLVVANEVIEHTFYPHFVLKEIKRVLRDDGYACISLPNAHNIYNRRDALFGRRVMGHGSFDSFAHHYFTNIERNREFITTEFKVIKEMFQWVEGGKAGALARVFRKPELFSFVIMFLCKK